MPSADEQLLEIYNAEFAPPSGWNISKARDYRQQLSGVKSGMLARYAMVGQITMGSTIIPDSFPFIQFSNETPTPDDTELLKRGTLIRNAMNKYDPYSTEVWAPLVKDGRGEKISYDKLKYRENMIADGPTPKDPAVEYLKSLPASPGPKMRIKSDAKSFTAAKYNPDTLFEWTDGEITDPMMLEIHHAIKRAAGDYLLTLYEEDKNRKIKIMELIDYEIRQNLRFGTEGKYVNRYSMRNALANLDPAKVSSLLNDNQIELEDNDYELFNPVIKVDNKGFQKWRKYADYKRKRYNHFMNVLKKGEVNTNTAITKMKDYVALNAEAVARRAAIDAIQRVKAARAVPATASAAGAAFAASVSNAAAIRAQNDDVDQFISDVKAMTSKADLNQYLTTIGVIDTSLLPNQQDRDNEMGQAVLDKEAELNAQPPPPQPLAPAFSRGLVMSNMGRADPTCGSDKTQNGYIARMTRLGFPKGDLLNATKLRGLIQKFSDDDLKKLFNGSTGGICPSDQEEILHIMSGKDKRLIVKYIKVLFGSNGAEQRAIIANNWSFSNDFTFVQKKVDLDDTWMGQKCARINMGSGYKTGKYDGRLVKIMDFDLSNETVDIRLIPISVDEQNNPMEDQDVSVEYLTPLTEEECDREAFNANLSIKKELADQKAALEEKERKKKEEQDRLAAEEAAAKAAKEAAEQARKDAEKAKQDRLNAMPKLKVEDGIGGWYPLKQDGKTKFYASSPDAIKLKNIPKNDHLIQYDNVEADEDGAYEIKGDLYVIEGRDKINGTSLLVTKNYGDALKDGDFKVRKTSLEEIRKIKDQAIEAIEALHAAGIVHQDIKLDNMVWDGQNLTVIDLGNARTVDKACKAQYNGDTMNIFPPPEIEGAKLADYWSLVLALLNLGGKNLQPVDDVPTGGGSSSISEALFTSAGRNNRSNKGCLEVGADSKQKGLLFINEEDFGKATTMRQAQINALVNREGEEGHVLFEYLWFVFMKKETVEDKSISGSALNGLIPGFGVNPTLENNDLMEFLTSQMPEKREDMARRWVQGHLQWEKLQAKLKGKEVYTATQAKILNPETNETRFESSTFEDLGLEYYGIPTNTVIEIFKMLTSKFPSIAQPVVDLSNPASLLDLDYDSFSDAELDEFEASLEPYDDEELEKLMDGALTGMAKEEYDSSSDSSRPSSVSYNSSSDTGFSETALSYDSSSDGGYSGAAHSYNSESEQSFHDSEHGASYDSDSDEDR